MQSANVRLHILCVAVFSTAWAQVSIPASPPDLPDFHSAHSLKPGDREMKRIPKSLLRTEIARLPASVTSDVAQIACAQEAADLGAVCGYVKVPLDRTHAIQGIIPIYFELYLHSGPGSAESAIL